MKAIINDSYGPPNVLQIKEIQKPIPADNEVRIKVIATTVTVADVRMRGFNVPRSYWLLARIALGFTKPKKKILGMELAGIIDAVGKNVTRYEVGDQVFASTFYHNYGAYVEYKCIPEDGAIAPKPANLSFGEAAVLPIGAITALHYLRRANIKPGQKILIYGASGSVGTYAVQIAKYFGVHVTGLCSTKNLEMVKSLGADEVIDYTKEDFSQGGETYDVILEAVDKSDFSDCMKVLKKGGLYMNITIPFPNIQMLWTRITTGTRLILGENLPATAEDLRCLKELVDSGILKPVIDRTYPFEQIVEAHQYVDKGHKKGNVVISVAQPNLPQKATTAPARIHPETLPLA